MKQNSELNSKLRELYSSLDIFKEVDDYNNRLQNEPENKAAYPFFIKVDESYEKADIKLMIFGQQTSSWGGTYGSGVTTDVVMNEYDSFLNNKYNDTCDRPFLKGMKEFMNKLKKEYSTIEYLWNNIVKMGYNKKGFPGKFYDSIVKPHLNELINKEIEILNPDYIIFFTGPDYDDNVLTDVFSNFKKNEVKGFPERELCEIIIPDIHCIKKAFRTYVPDYFLTYHPNDIDKYYEYINKIIEEIISDIQLRRT